MTVVDHVSQDEKMLITAMALCSDAELDPDTGEAAGEPTECALVNDASKAGLPKPELKKTYPRIGEAPFDSMRKMMSTIHETADHKILQFTKGAPDEVLKRCTKASINGSVVPMTEEIRQEILTSNKAMADRALRVLCGAMREWPSRPESSEPEVLEQELTYLGLSGMIDPRPSGSKGRYCGMPGSGHPSHYDYRRSQRYGRSHRHGTWHYLRFGGSHHRCPAQ